MPDKKRILLVDDHQLIIDGIRGFIEHDGRYQVIGEANDGHDAIRLADVLNPHVILMDIEMPGLSGIAACEEIKRKFPQVKVIIISMHNDKELIKKLIGLGADGYLLKNSQQTEVLDAITKVLNNQSYFSNDVTLSLLDKTIKNHSESNTTTDLSELTERETEILKLVAEGMTNKEIGDELNISHRTVDTHRTNLMKKLDVTNVAGLIRLAYKNNLLK
ncbi:MAG: response regulator transcription factor [Crocinitomicaceae bacterium]|nr:response regulator transcription factor [Crocinitomicaceae bacterium]MBK8927791.1 response regulator transcription factor [Crocinitomicaceae bacterium]